MKQIYLIILVALSMLIMAGCVTETVDTPPPGTNPVNPDEEIALTLALNIPASTRGLTTPQEDAIRYVDVLAFAKDGTDYKLAEWKYGIIDSNQNGEVTFVVKLKPKAYRIMVLANSRTMTYGLFNGDNLGGKINMLYADVCALLQTKVPAIDNLAANGIPLWGELESDVAVSKTLPQQTLTLIRSLARIDVGTAGTPTFTPGQEFEGFAPIDNFSLQAVYVYNANEYYRIAPTRSLVNFTTNRVSDYTLPPAPNNTKITPATYYDQISGTEPHDGYLRGIKMVREIYCAEADIKMGGIADEEYADGNHAERMAIVVAGKYTPNGDDPADVPMSYYRIDFNGGGTSTALHDILRNNAYQIIITQVNGPGSTSADEAFTKFNADLKLVINAWNQVTSNTTIDGEYYLTVDPYDFTFDKWAKTDEEITITTNVAPDALSSKSWTASVTKVNPADDVSWLTITAGTENGVSGDILKINATQFAGTGNRQAYISIKAGNMTHNIKVVQNDSDGDFMLRLSHSELVFAGRKWNGTIWTDPDPQAVTVKWGPPIKDYVMLLSAYTESGVEGFTPVSPSNNDTQTITLDAISETDQRVIDNPFFERSSRLGFTIENVDGSETITKQILIRQIFYSLVVTDTKDYYYQGSTYSITIRSNSKWAISYGGDESIFASRSVPSTNGSTAATGEKFNFTIDSNAAVGARATVTFSSPDNLFPSQTINITVQDVQPNSYIVTPGTANFQVPVSKAYRVWEFDHDLLAPLTGANEEAVLLWQDQTGLITSVGLSGTGASAKIVLTTGFKEGNAVVAYKSDGAIRWSWHIWVTNYNPTATGNFVTVNNANFMNRLLGATGNTGYDAYGLHYQGGRKDPFPPAAALTGTVRRKIYNIGNVELNYNQPGGIINEASPATDGLAVAIQKPMSFLLATYGSMHWYGQLIRTFRTDMWHNQVEKADYDPCPKGWKVPTQDNYSGFITSVRPETNTWNGLYYPLQGYLIQNNGTLHENGTGFITGLIIDPNYNPIPAYITVIPGRGTELGLIINDARSIRCVQE